MHTTALVLAAFAADSLALGAHWIYDTAEIDRRFGRITSPLQPAEDCYHKHKEAGEFTHYGDQTLVLLQSLTDQQSFSLDAFGAAWQQYMASYQGYHDKASLQTLKNLQEEKGPANSGSASSELGGAARIGPLIFLLHDDPQALSEAVHRQTRLTHNSVVALAGAEALARICVSVLHGTRPTQAIIDVLDAGTGQIELDMRLRAGLDTAGRNSRETIRAFGQNCATEAALPGVIHLVASYENDLETALIENVMAGGDSAARGMCAGMILGAHGGLQAVPKRWLDAMQPLPRIKELLESLTRGRQEPPS